MSLQQTIEREIRLRGIEPYGGNTVEVGIYPAEPDTGYVFQTMDQRSVRATLDTASASMSSMMLDNGELGHRNLRVVHVEHILAALYAYGIDNAIITLKRWTNGLRFYRDATTRTEVVPNFEQRELTLCDELDDNVVEQYSERKVITVGDVVENPFISFRPINSSALTMSATTDYHFSDDRMVESYGLEINPENFKYQLSRARPYVKHFQLLVRNFPKIAMFFASFAYSSFGVGHGFSKDLFFYPASSKEEWIEESQRFYIDGKEIARHTIVDRLGALALLGARMEGVQVRINGSNHKNDLMFLKDNRGSFSDL